MMCQWCDPGRRFLQLLAESEQIKAGKQTDERRGIAIAMRVAFSFDLVDDESVRSDRAANAIMTRSPTFSPAAETTTPPQTSGPAAPRRGR